MTIFTRIFQPASAWITHTPDAPLLTRARVVTNSKPPSQTERTSETSLIYAVDDDPELTELYTNLLEVTGYSVRTFNDRAEALAVLKADRTKPNLLITDYLGLSMPVDSFMHRSLAVHPTLRILMASGLSPKEVRFSSVRPDRFIQKPFTGEEFLEEVRAALAHNDFHLR